MLKLFTILLVLGSFLLASCGRLSDSIWTPTGTGIGAGGARVANLGPFTPGTFEGVGPDGYYGYDILVNVTFDATRITAIEVTEHHETPAFANPAFNALTQMVLQSQTYMVDIFTGATVTSHAFLAAIQDAILQAGGRMDDGAAAAGALGPFTPGTFAGVGPDGYYGYDILVNVTFDASRITAIEVTEHHETPAFANPAFNALTSRVLEAQTYNVDIFTGATVTSHAFLRAIADAVEQTREALGAGTAGGLGPFTPGTFEGEGEGYYDIVRVAVTFDATRIVAVEIIESNDTPIFEQMVFPVLIPRVLQEQTYDVDIIVGATVTSYGFLDAVFDAVWQASR